MKIDHQRRNDSPGSVDFSDVQTAHNIAGLLTPTGYRRFQGRVILQRQISLKWYKMVDWRLVESCIWSI